MLLDEIIAERHDRLNTAIRLLLDGTASGEMFTLTYDSAAATNYAIAMELVELLARQKPRDPTEIWQDILKILRLLPWIVDSELHKPTTPEQHIAGVYHFFGGFSDCALDELRPMVEDGKTWEEIVQKACLLAGDLV